MDVCYYQNSIKRKGGYYYTATFSLIFEHHGDTVYIAHSYPYTYTDLQRYSSGDIVVVPALSPTLLLLHVGLSGTCTGWSATPSAHLGLGVGCCVNP